jgi:UTP--glucose-1-phosphate uridylyltransferase
MISLANDQRFSGVRFQGRTFDCGAKVGFLAANVAFALSRPDIADEFRSALADIISADSGTDQRNA